MAPILGVFGVAPCVEAVYITLLSKPMARVPQIAEELGMSEAAVHEALDELSRLSLVGMSRDDPDTAQPISPDVGLKYLLAREQVEVLQRLAQIENGRAAIASLIAELPTGSHEPPADASLIQVLGLDAVRVKLRQLAYETRYEVLSLMPDGAQTPDNMAASQPLDEMLLDRRVRMRTVYLDSVRNEPNSRQYANWLIEQGGQVRTTAVLPLRMIVCDRKVAVLPLNPRRSEGGVAIINGEGPAAAMCALFEQIWEVATPFGEAPAPHPDLELTQQEVAVVRFLAEGDTDETISRKLGFSTRTAGRIASEIMAKLNAKSRFQAGVRVAERGWHLVPASRPAPAPGEANAPLSPT